MENGKTMKQSLAGKVINWAGTCLSEHYSKSKNTLCIEEVLQKGHGHQITVPDIDLSIASVPSKLLPSLITH